jgi:hypothetical protein
MLCNPFEIKTTRSSETSADFQRAKPRYIAEDKTVLTTAETTSNPE